MVASGSGNSNSKGVVATNNGSSSSTIFLYFNSSHLQSVSRRLNLVFHPSRQDDVGAFSFRRE